MTFQKLNLIFRLALGGMRLHRCHFLAIGISVTLGIASVLAFIFYNRFLVESVEKVFQKKYMLGDFVLSSSATSRDLSVSKPDLTPAVIQRLNLYLAGDRDLRAVAWFISATGVAEGADEAANFRASDWSGDRIASSEIRNSDESARLVLGRELARLHGCSIPGEKIRPDTALLFASPPGVLKCSSATLKLTANDGSGSLLPRTFSIDGATNGLIPDIDRMLILASDKGIAGLLKTDNYSYAAISLQQIGLAPGFLLRLHQWADSNGIDVFVRSWKDTIYGQVYRSIVSSINAYTWLVAAVLSILSVVALTLSVAGYASVASKEFEPLGIPEGSEGWLSSIVAVQGLLAGFLGFGAAMIILFLLKMGLRFFLPMHAVGGLSLPVPIDFTVQMPLILIGLLLALLCPAGVMVLLVRKVGC